MKFDIITFSAFYQARQGESGQQTASTEAQIEQIIGLLVKFRSFSPVIGRDRGV
jgi:hypothetical protein